MKMSYNWLKELTGLSWPAEEAARRLTMCGTAVEEIEPMARYLDRVVVGEVVELMPIEGASDIRVARVNVDSRLVNSVCGAPNVAVGQKVPLALEGARLAGDIEMKRVEIRGVESTGMICSEREIGISQDHSGIMVLDSDAPVGRPLAEYLNLDDYVLTFELTPNRPDSMSAIGLARDLAALASVSVRRPQFALTESSRAAVDHVQVSIDDPHGCPRYAARVIRDVKIASTPWWVKTRLLMSGVRPINNVVDITNYVMLECGHPLHAFDLDRLGSNRIVVRRARDKERFTALDETEHSLSPHVLLITNGREPVAAAGVMGGLDSEVTDSTVNVLLEAAYFNPAVIRGSRRALDKVSESSMRFEKGADPNGIEYAINRAAHLMGDIAGGQILRGIVDCYPETIDPRLIKLRSRRCNAVLGTAMTEERMKRILTGLEFEVGGTDTLEVTVPTFRPDLEREIDLIEEIARMEGWDAIPDAVTNLGPLFTPRDVADVFRNDVRRILTAVGFDEILGHGFANRLLMEAVSPGSPYLRLLNSVSQELDAMRNTLVPGGLAVVAHNLAHRNLNLSLFELGKVYFPPDDRASWREEERLLLAVTGSTEGGWRRHPRPCDFFDLTGALERLAEHFRWPGMTFRSVAVPFLEQGISFKVELGGEACGVVGEVARSLLDRFDIKQPTYIAQLELDRLISQPPTAHFVPLPSYPAAPRDLAVIVGEDVPAGELTETVRRTAGDMAESVAIFDLYTGKQIPKGKKSIAISITYRSPAGSLSSAQVDELQLRVIENLEHKYNAEIRDK